MNKGLITKTIKLHILCYLIYRKEVVRFFEKKFITFYPPKLQNRLPEANFHLFYIHIIKGTLKFS